MGNQTVSGKRTPAGKKRELENRKVITKNGETLFLTEDKKTKLASFLASTSKKIKDQQQRTLNMTIHNKGGKLVGTLDLYNEGHGSLNVAWIHVTKENQGRGYGSAVIRDVVQMAKSKGYKKITLEVPGSSPDALHIYEKNGFKVVKQLTPEDEPVWGGLTAMELNMGYENYLAHYGVKGMRWGVRRYRNYDGSYTKKGLKYFDESSKKYDEANQMYKSAKQWHKESKKNGHTYLHNYETGETQKVYVTKDVVKQAKQARKAAKQQMKADYKQVKKDYKADKGKALYQSGKTIGSNNDLISKIGSVSAGAILASKYLSDSGYGDLAKYSFYAGAGLAAVSGILGVKAGVENNQLRAYYSHSRPARN